MKGRCYKCDRPGSWTIDDAWGKRSACDQHATIRVRSIPWRGREDDLRRLLLDVILLDGEQDAAPSLEDMAKRARDLLGVHP